jgi:GH25 family lysozyme M1 (1,4-beta-N-acetylmuramidase)
VLTKSKRAIAVSALALATGGAAAVVIQAASSSPSSTVVSAAALPSAAGPAATAAVPRGAGSADGTGGGTVASGTTGGAVPSRAATGPAAAGSAPASPVAAKSAATPAVVLPADGAVPGSSTAARQLAAARKAQTARPHSPQLLAQLKDGKVSPAAVSAAADAGAASGAASAAGRTLPGLDVASFQHPGTAAAPNGQAISWPSVFAAGYKFAAVKATEGNYYVNPWAATDLAGARTAGLDVAPYTFAVPNVSGGAQQAGYAVKYSGYKSGARMLPLMLDIEYDPYNTSDNANSCYGLSSISMKAWISAFVTTAKTLTGQYPLIYTTADWWSTCTANSTAFSADPMWVAAYGTSSPPMPAGWKYWTFWQYTSSGTVRGVATTAATDVDYFSPTALALLQPPAQSAAAGTKVRLQLTSLGQLAGERLTYQVSGLPPGVAMSKAALIIGTVKKSAATSGPRTYTVTVLAKNPAGVSAKIKFSLRVTPA